MKMDKRLVAAGFGVAAVASVGVVYVITKMTGRPTPTTKARTSPTQNKAKAKNNRLSCPFCKKDFKTVRSRKNHIRDKHSGKKGK